MIPLENKQYWNRSILSATVRLSLSALLASAMAQSATGGVSGTIRVMVNDQTVPLAGAKVTVSNVSSNRDEHEAVTDKTGRYTIDLPEGTYNIRFFWSGGDCSIVHRAPFRLNAGERFNFDFLTMHCPNTERRGPAWKYEQEYSMDVPLANQGDAYREQIIPAEQDRWPQIIVSFGRYDNRVDEIRYFPTHQRVGNAPVTAAPLLLSLPVTVTVDKYTLQAQDVVLDKKSMIFTAKGVVFISDGKNSKVGNWGTLSFSGGRPIVKMEH